MVYSSFSTTVSFSNDKSRASEKRHRYHYTQGEFMEIYHRMLLDAEWELVRFHKSVNTIFVFLCLSTPFFVSIIFVAFLCHHI